LVQLSWGKYIFFQIVKKYTNTPRGRKVKGHEKKRHILHTVDLCSLWLLSFLFFSFASLSLQPVTLCTNLHLTLKVCISFPGHYNEEQSGWLKQQEFIVSQFWGWGRHVKHRCWQGPSASENLVKALLHGIADFSCTASVIPRLGGYITLLLPLHMASSLCIFPSSFLCACLSLCISFLFYEDISQLD
jgi:hypothetical protein